MKAMATPECEEETLPVTCGNQTGVMHLCLFLCPGIHQECIKVNDQMVTPKMFSVMGDKEKLKDWKNAIRIRGVSVRKMMDTGELNYYKHKELCSGKCVSRNMGGSKYDISRFERDHELPSFPPLIAAMEASPQRSRDAISQPVFPMAMAVSIGTDSNDGSEAMLEAVTDQSEAADAENSQNKLLTSNEESKSSDSCENSEDVKEKKSSESKESKESKSISPSPTSCSPSPTPPKLSGAAKRKSKSVKKEVVTQFGQFEGQFDSPIELTSDIINPESCEGSLDCIQAEDASQINDPYLHRALMGLADCNFPNLTECFMKREPQDFAEDLTAKSELVATTIVSKTLKHANGQRNNRSESRGTSRNGSRSQSPSINGKCPNNDCDDPRTSQNVDQLLSLDIREDSQQFWRGVMDLGLINDFFREMKNSLDVLKNDLIKGRNQQEDSQKVSDIVTNLGLATKLRWKLEGKKNEGEGGRDHTVLELPSLKRKMVDADHKRNDHEKRAEGYSRLEHAKGTSNGVTYTETNGSGTSRYSESEAIAGEPQDLSYAQKHQPHFQMEAAMEAFTKYNSYAKATSSMMNSLRNGTFNMAHMNLLNSVNGNNNGHLELGERIYDNRNKKRRKNSHRTTVTAYQNGALYRC